LQSFSLMYKTQPNCECYSVLNFARVEHWEWSRTSSKLRLSSILDSWKYWVSSVDLYLPSTESSYVFDLRSPNLEDCVASNENWSLPDVVLLQISTFQLQVHLLYYEYFPFVGGVFGLYDGRMDPLVRSCVMGTNEVHYWGDLNDPVPCWISEAINVLILLLTSLSLLSRSRNKNTDCHHLDDTVFMYNTVQDIFRNKCYSNLHH